MLRKLVILSTLFVFCLTPSLHAQKKPRFINAFVALCDNVHQGIVPVPGSLGNGNDPRRNLYWGAIYGIKTFFKRSENWQLIKTTRPSSTILERIIFKHKTSNVYFVADAYRGKEIKQAITDFLDSASGQKNYIITANTSIGNLQVRLHGLADLVVYIGHDGLMDFNLNNYPAKMGIQSRETIILACYSKKFFKEAITKAGATPLLWTTGLMAPEAYTLEEALAGWILGESNQAIRNRAASAYHKYQKCGLKAAKRLLVTGH